MGTGGGGSGGGNWAYVTYGDALQNAIAQQKHADGWMQNSLSLEAALFGANPGIIEAKTVYKTQKARGLEAGWAISIQSGYGYKVAPHYGVMPHIPPAALKALVFPKFARPCPIVPRHGFVESRDVKNIHELEALFKETREHDDAGELIVMDRLSGKFSAVMTAGGVSWGLSNDGITGGKGENRTIPCPAGRFDQTFLPYLSVDPNANEGVYCELVEDKGAVCVVQMRLGPKQPDSRVKRITVALATKLHTVLQPPNDDLIEWDRLLKKDENRLRASRILVWLPKQTMSSHFAVQAIANGYNVSVEDECPAKEGDILKPATDGLAPLEAGDYVKLSELLTAEKKTRFWDYPRDVLLSIATLHALPYWDNAPHLLALRARGVMIAARYGLAACLGESRHHSHMSTRSAKVPWHDLLDTDLDGQRPSRSYVFVRSFAMPWEKGPELALAAAEDMRIGDQPPVMEYLAKGGKLGDYSASFMGQKWEWASLRVHDLHVAVDRFCKDATQANWNVVLGHYNEIINATHNGGYLLNKWCSPSLIDNAAAMPSIVFGFRNVMQLVWGHQKEEPRVPWLTMSQKPKESGKFVELDSGILVPSLVWMQLEEDGVVDAEQCKCEVCMKPKYDAMGTAAIAHGLPIYVPDDDFHKMPKFPLGDDHYSQTIEAIVGPVNKMDHDENEPECVECGYYTLSDGQCTNENCHHCPDYVDPDAESDDDEEPTPTEAEVEKPDADGVPKE